MVSVLSCSPPGLVALTRLIRTPGTAGICPINFYRPRAATEIGEGHLEGLHTLAPTYLKIELAEGCSSAVKKLLCSMGIWAMAEVNWWNMFSTHPLIEREIRAYMRGSTWRSAVYTARSCWSMGSRGFLPPPRAKTKLLRVLSSAVSATVPSPYLAESQIHWTQSAALLGRCPELSSASLVFLLSQRQLFLWFPMHPWRNYSAFIKWMQNWYGHVILFIYIFHWFQKLA